jgi:hypothetical protein
MRFNGRQRRLFPEENAARVQAMGSEQVGSS